MKVFNYSQYIKCIHTLRLNAVLQLAERNAEYNLENSNKKYSHDALIKNILRDTKEAEKFINQFLEPREPIKSEDLIHYTNNYITRKYKSKEADLVYQLKNQEVFFLIEHQSTIDNKMPYRLLNYCIDIMQEWGRNKKIGRNTRYPIVVPVVIYTGNQKWNLPKNFKEKQISSYVFERYKIDLEYNFIDINKISKRTLLQRNTMFSYIMLIEKSENKEQLLENLNLLIQTVTDRGMLDELASIVTYLLDNLLKDEEQLDLLEKIHRKVGEKGMSTLYDRLLAENRRMIKQGEKVSQKKIAQKMLVKKLDDEIILETTGIKREELEQIKNKLAIAG